MATKESGTEQRIINGWSLLEGGLLLAFLLTACVVDRSLWRGVITTKYFYFTAMLCLAVPLTGYLAVYHKYRFPLIRYADLAVALFAVYAIFHRLVVGGGNQMHWWLFLLMIPFYAVVRFLTERRDGIHVLTVAILLIVLAETLWGIMQLAGFLPSYHTAFPVTGSFFNPAPYAGLVAVGIPLALGQFFIRGISRGERMLGGMVLAASLLVLPFTGSRAAWLAALAGVLAATWQGCSSKRESPAFPSFFRGGRRIAFFTILAVTAILLTHGLYHMKKDSADGRLLIWNVSASVIKEHPVAGVGIGRFAAVYGQAQADHFLSGKGTTEQVMLADHPDYAFNEGVHVAVELGLAGLFLFLLAIGTCLWPKQTRVPRKSGEISAGYCLSSFTGLLVFSLFSYPFSVLPLSILFVTLLAALASRTPPPRRQPSSKMCVAGWGALVLLTAAVAIQVLPRRQSYREWRETSSLFRAGDNAGALDEYLILYPSLKYEKNFLMEYARCLSHLGRHEESNRLFRAYLDLGCNPEAYNYMGNNYKAMGQHDKAEQAYTRSCLVTPNRHYPEYLLMKLYHETGRESEAIEKARLLRDKPVKVNSPVIKLIRAEAAKIVETSNPLNE